MSTTPEKPIKKEKAKRQTPEERLKSLQYNHMMYGPTAGEVRPTAKKVDYGAPYLKHAKFLTLMTAFKQGVSSEFNVSEKNKSYTISTDGTHILFNKIIIYYSRSLNKYECSLLLDRSAAIQYQSIDAFVHLALAVLRSLPELGTPQLRFANKEFYYGTEKLETGIAENGPNLLIGPYRNNLSKEKTGHKA